MGNLTRYTSVKSVKPSKKKNVRAVPKTVQKNFKLIRGRICTAFFTESQQ